MSLSQLSLAKKWRQTAQTRLDVCNRLKRKKHNGCERETDKKEKNME